MKKVLVGVVAVLVVGAGAWIGSLYSQINSLENEETDGYVKYTNSMLAENLDFLINLVYYDMNDNMERLDETLATNELSSINAKMLDMNMDSYRVTFYELNRIGINLLEPGEEQNWTMREVMLDFKDLISPYQTSTVTSFPLKEHEIEQFEEMKQTLTEWTHIMEDYIDIPQEDLYDATKPEWRQLLVEMNEVTR